MSALGNIIKKEVRELLTPATFIPIIVIALIFGTLGNTIGSIEEQMEEKPIIGFIDADNSNLSFIATSILDEYADVVYNSSDLSDKEKGVEEIKEKDGIALLIIPSNFSDEILGGKPGEIGIYWIMKGAGVMDSISSAVVNELISTIDTNLSYELISTNASVNATTALTPTFRNETTYFKGIEIQGLSPEDIASMLSSQSTLIPIIMMMIIIMAGSMVISSMALEKENKTLETLLTLPVKRTSIVAGKIIASAIIGLMLAIIYMIGLGYWMQSFQISEGVSLADFNLVLSATDLLIVGISVFVTLIAALSLCMLLGTMAKNYKSAQTLTFPVTMLALIPMFITMVKDFDTLPLALKGILFGIPFSHPMMAPRALIFDDYLIVISGIIYVSIFALIMIILAVWVFKTDRLLTGSTRRRKVKNVKRQIFNLRK
jgi:ABC-2 type transport system permease protein